MKVPLIYKGLHEVCALYGSESHQIEVCPNLPLHSKVEIVVEKFNGASGLSSDTVNQPPSSSIVPVTTIDNWIGVSHKKRFKSMTNSGIGKTSPLKPTSQPKVTIVNPVMHPTSIGFPSRPVNFGTPDEGDSSLHMSPVTHDNTILLAQPAQGMNLEDPVNEDPLNAMEEDMPEESNDNIFRDSQNLFVAEDMADTFLNFDPIQELGMSSESSKRRRVEE